MNEKVALITGASSGIGRATALAFAAKGASVVLAARRQEELDSLVAEIKTKGGKATAIRTDVSDAREAEQMVAHAIATFGRLDYAVNNAGIEGLIANIVDLEEADWDRVLDINLKGNYLCLRFEARAMLEGGHGGAIVNVGSVNSFLGFGSGAAYVASKHGQVGLTTSASAELAPHGIRVNIVCPGFVDTPMHHRIRGIIGDEPFDNAMVPQVHVRRVGKPEEIAAAILFLCSDEASYITGTALTPDGGFTMTV
ncbi:MAG TPA: glucose 1-dehydrogenase [Pyrinomonadaceae bacterium]|nr:glucose 1-dehydrogenase [Pyrinomonadaceae bacterium]